MKEKTKTFFKNLYNILFPNKNIHSVGYNLFLIKNFIITSLCMVLFAFIKYSKDSIESNMLALYLIGFLSLLFHFRLFYRGELEIHTLFLFISIFAINPYLFQATVLYILINIILKIVIEPFIEVLKERKELKNIES